MCWIRLSSCALALLLLGCGGGVDEPGGPGGEAGAASCAPGEAPLEDGSCLVAGMQPTGCAAGETFVPADRSCRPAGIQANGCAAGQLHTDDGCQPAGIPPEACAVGFVDDGDHGCEPVLPDAPCPAGTMAVVGETSCREVAPCGSAPYAGVPTDTATQHVDGSFGGVSDGSAAAPWPTVQQAIDAAEPGAVVAVAAGSYVGDLTIAGKSVRLWGRCPTLVEIVGTDSGAAAVTVGAGADGTEIRDIAVRGPADGIVVDGVTLQAEAVWLHDLGGSALQATDGATPAGFTLLDSLVEAAHDQALWALGADATIERCLVRDTTPADDGRGWGLTVEENLDSHVRPSLLLEASVFERNVQGGVVVHAADAEIRRTVVRNTSPDPAGRYGRALMVQTEAAASGPAVVLVRGCVLADSYEAGIMVHASQLDVEHTVIRDTGASVADARFGNGIVCQYDWLLEAGSECHVRQSLLDRNTENGLLLGGSDATLEGVLVRDTQPWPSGDTGRGITVQYDRAAARNARLQLVGSRLEANRDAGLAVDGAEVTVEGTEIRDTVPRELDGSHGWGLVAQDNLQAQRSSSLVLRDSRLTGNADLGLVVAGSDARIVGTVVEKTEPAQGGLTMGRGMSLQANLDTGHRTTFELMSSVVADNHEVGVAIGGADGVIEGTVVRDTQPEPSGERHGRGMAVQTDPTTFEPSNVVLRFSRIERNHEVGIFVGGSRLTVESTRVVDTLAQVADGAFGDGVAAVHFIEPALTGIHHSVIERSRRGGLASFGSVVEVRGSRVSCNAVDLNGEVVNQSTFHFSDLGRNECGCDDDEPCRVLSSELNPPSPSPIE